MIADSLASVGVMERFTATCAHCGQPVPRVDPCQERQFCCNGCASVFSILNASGLQAYYEKRDALGETGTAAVVAGRAYEELDQPEFASVHCRALAGGRLGTELFLENVHCAACVWLVEKVAAIVPGVTEARLDLGKSTLSVSWDPAVASLSRIARFLDSVGYPGHPLHGLDAAALHRREDHALLMKMGVAGACAGNAMLFAVALYCGAFSGMDAGYVALFRWGSALVALPSVLWSASVFYRGALAAIRTFTPHMDLPISIGIAVGSASSVASAARGRGEVFFDTLTMLIFLLLVGRWLQQRAQRRADGAADALRALTPGSARVVEGGGVREVPVESVLRGALVEVRAGDHVPVDGTVLEGASAIDVSLLTGESLPVEVGPASIVHAGSVNVSGRLLVRADGTGQETRLGRLVKAVADASSRCAPTVILANRLAAWFVVTVLAASAVTVLALWHRGADVALGRAVALLVVTCPCALGLATPLAVSAAIGRAARAGIMVKGGDCLEALARPGLVVFDKTGTLTEGKLSLVDFRGDAAVKALVAAAEASSAHPIARALCEKLDAGALVAESVRQTPGGGLTATVEGRSVVVGSAPFVERTAKIPRALSRVVAEFGARGMTPVVVAVDGEVRAVAAVADEVRADARSSLERLRAMGHRLAILSGDQPAVVAAVAARIGVAFEEIASGAAPEEKLAFIEAHARSGPVFMVGDGVNDAAALSAATVGIAVRGGAEASLAAADVFATRGGLCPVVDLFAGARRTLRVIRGNLARSLVYNLGVGALAATGSVGPLLAALLMPVSSLGVITSSYRSRTFGDDR